MKIICKIALALSVCAGWAMAQTTYVNGSLTIEGTVNYCGSSTGSVNAYVCANPTGATIRAYRRGAFYSFNASSTNTGAATLAIDGLTATTISKQGGSFISLVSGDIQNGQVVVVQYDGTRFQMQSTSGNATGGGGGGASSLAQLSDFLATVGSSTVTFNGSNNGVHLSSGFYSYPLTTTLTRTSGTAFTTVWVYIDPSTGFINAVDNSANTYSLSNGESSSNGSAYPNGAYSLYICADTGTAFSNCVDQRPFQAQTSFLNITSPYYGVKLSPSSSGTSFQSVLPIVLNAATSYTMQLADQHTFQSFTASAAKNVIIPTTTTTGFGIYDFVIENELIANSALTLTPNSGSTLIINGASVANVSITGGQAYYCVGDGVSAYHCRQW